MGYVPASPAGEAGALTRPCHLVNLPGRRKYSQGFCLLSRALFCSQCQACEPTALSRGGQNRLWKAETPAWRIHGYTYAMTTTFTYPQDLRRVDVPGIDIALSHDYY